MIPEAFYNEGLRLLDISPYFASFALWYAADCPALMLCGYLIKTVPDVYICKFEVHRTFFVKLHAEPIEIEPFAEVGAMAHYRCIKWATLFIR